MKVLIKTIGMARDYKDNKYQDVPDRRDIGAVVLDEHAREFTYRLPAVETDGLIVVGGVYELMFVRRES